MSKIAMEKAGEIIASKTDYVGGGMEGFVVLNLIDEEGYPSGSAITISKAQGIEWVSMLTSMNSNKVRRIGKNSKAGLVFASPEYNISLVGTIEIITDPTIRKDHWQDVMTENHGSYDSPDYCMLLFKTNRYNIYLANEGLEVQGRLSQIS
ncbi:MAG: pyridoxamine 5'-phosphate oxidase family protein [Defluviitaleaceae bacterium]|nr:pyridoxamine 5'-phosphate oxidase family protein [Defluviitaleaceae bacterium]